MLPTRVHSRNVREDAGYQPPVCLPELGLGQNEGYVLPSNLFLNQLPTARAPGDTPASDVRAARPARPADLERSTSAPPGRRPSKPSFLPKTRRATSAITVEPSRSDERTGPKGQPGQSQDVSQGGAKSVSLEDVRPEPDGGGDEVLDEESEVVVASAAKEEAELAAAI